MIAIGGGRRAAAVPPIVRQPRRRRVRCPTVLQMESVECGPAALSMILAYHGRWVPLADLRQDCGVSRDGTTLNAIARVAKEHGLAARPLRVDPRGLDELKLPAIAFWNHEHFLVVERVDARRIWINDPALGRRSMSRAEFEADFSHVAIELEPGPDFSPCGAAPQPFRRMARRLSGSIPTLVFVTVCALALGVTGFAMLSFTQIFMDHILSQGRTEWAPPLLIAMIGTLILRGLLGWMGRFYLIRLKARMMALLATDLTDRMLRLPLRFFAMRDVGEVAARFKAVDILGNAMSVHMAGLVIGLITALFYSVAMLSYDGVLVMAGLGSLLLTLGLTSLSLRWFLNAGGTMVMHEGRLAGAAVNVLQVIETIKSMGLEGGVFRRLAGLHAEVAAQRRRIELGHRLMDAAPRLISELGALAVLALGIARVMNGGLSLGQLVVFQALLGTVQTSIVSLLGEAGHLQAERTELIKADDILHHPIAPEPAPSACATDALIGRIEFRDVTFGYNPKAPPLISHLSFTVPAGTQIALVGETGSGKSTIVQLLTGLYQPWSGTILIDDMPLACVPAPLRARTMAAVEQRIYLFEGSVRDNLTLWDATIHEADLIRAARDAEIHDLIRSRPGGYDGPVAEAGGNFSGGEAQRLDLARALAGDPAVLVLDEATAALDSLTEARILANLARRRMTRFVVAHRLSAVRDSNTILVMRDGQVIERGTHAALIRSEGAYAQLVRTD